MFCCSFLSEHATGLSDHRYFLLSKVRQIEKYFMVVLHAKTLASEPKLKVFHKALADNFAPGFIPVTGFL